MAGLNLIQSYLSESSDSDNEEKSETNDVANSSSVKNKFEKLPVPQSILLWKGTEHHENVHDDPSQHDGRIRSFKHERGNWPTLVYFNYADIEAIHSWLEGISAEFDVEKELKIFDEFHLSLTRSLILKFHWIESFVDGIKRLCQNTNDIVIEFGDFKVYCNEERTRTFLGIQCEDRSKRLDCFVGNLDRLLEEYKLPPFYEEASFHISVLWCLGDAEERLKALLPSLNENLNRAYVERSLERYLKISNVNCKIGNKMYTFSFR